ncbi:complement factor H-like [Anabas testudineus]|uniref:complement factor H-like n=1 Tax=Anabas testudineus TaxID=64144 RepID=UPI000E45F8C4|nr:complement factor H-like [Anabas testudineus]
MRFFHHLWVFILWLNVDESFQQIEIKCTVPVIDNGHVLEDVKEYRENEILHFVCNNKYKRTEERPSKCVQVGERADWSPTPACELIKCKLDLPPLKGITYDPAFRNLFLPGDRVRVTCEQRYGIFGSWDLTAETTCKDNGEWTVRPVCQEVVCIKQDPHVSRWYVDYWRNKITLGETVRYSCRSGYKETAAEATCSRGGWEPNPLCQEMTCDRRDVQNADITNNDKMIYKYNERVRYVCSEGFTGQFTLTCGKHGWSGNPRCTEITCEPPSNQYEDIINYKGQYRYNEQIDLKCRVPYKGSFSLTCGERGWIGQQKCTEIKCNTLQHIDPNANLEGTRQEYWHNERVYYACKTGGGGYSLTCGENGWIGTSSCKETTCKKKNIVKAYIVRNNKNIYSQDETVEYECSTNKEIRFNVTCDKGVWTDIQSCPDLKCPKPKLENGFIVGPYNDTVYFTCGDSYKLLSSGWWGEAKCNGSVYVGLQPCIGKDKCRPPVIPNGSWTPQLKMYEPNKNIQIQCNEGYNAVVSQLTCREGQWKTGEVTPPIFCTPSSCKPPPKVDNAVVMESYQSEYLSGSEVTYQCKDDLRLEAEGGDTIRCQDGEWENKNIECTKVPGCETPPALLDGDLRDTMKSQYRHNERVEYMCQTYYTMEGEPHRTCINGAWTGYMRCLKPCIVNEVDIRQNNITLTSSDKKYLVHDEVIEFRCASGTPVGTTAMRQRCNSGEIMLPACY